RSKWWYVSLPGDSYKALSGVLEYARKRKIKVALNPSYKHFSGDGKRQGKWLSAVCQSGDGAGTEGEENIRMGCHRGSKCHDHNDHRRSDP
ncbi:MAG: hypothetical protein UV46_C0038G0001, partial [Candidatus Gottesmanbacteria bacterium GW2011_GWC2_42_8]